MSKIRKLTKQLKKLGIISIKTVDDAKKWMKNKGWAVTIFPYNDCQEIIIDDIHQKIFLSSVTVEYGHEFEGLLSCIINIAENRKNELTI